MKLTRAEHEARAMLMGMVYDPRDGTYCPNIAGDGVAPNGMVDCLTLEFVDHNAVKKRLSYNAGQYVTWARRYQIPTQPWELPDNEGPEQ